MTKRYFGIIPAAGIGQRFGSTTPKQYTKIAGKTALEHSIDALLALPELEKCVVVLHEQDCYWQQLPCSKHPKIITAIGGKERSDSVLNGLNALAEIANTDDLVLIHDAARPYVPLPDLINLTAAAQRSSCGAILAAPVVDTLKQVLDGRRINKSIPRQHLYRALTPQCFPYLALKQALLQCQHNNINITDDAMAFELLQQQPDIVMGNPWNIKLTYPEDIAVIASLLHN